MWFQELWEIISNGFSMGFCKELLPQPIEDACDVGGNSQRVEGVRQSAVRPKCVASVAAEHVDSRHQVIMAS